MHHNCLDQAKAGEQLMYSVKGIITCSATIFHKPCFLMFKPKGVHHHHFPSIFTSVGVCGKKSTIFMSKRLSMTELADLEQMSFLA